MRILVLFAHPVETSFGAALHELVVRTLKSRSHDVDDCDLYAESFDPVLTREERMVYDDPSANRRNVAPYVDRLLAAEALVFCFPVWNMGFPAILKGFVDRVFLPGVSFRLEENGDYVPMLHNIKRLGAVCTYGGARADNADGRPAASCGDAHDPRHLRARSGLRLPRAVRHGSPQPRAPEEVFGEGGGKFLDLVNVDSL